MANCIYKYKGKDYTKEEFYSLIRNSNFIQQEQVKKFAELQERLNNKEFLEGAKNAFESNEELQNVYYEAAGFKGENSNPYDIKDFSFFASFGNPKGFLEAKRIGESNDRLPKTTQYKNTDFYTALEILNDGRKKLSIHFKHLEQGSNRGGGHAGLVFVFDKNKKIDNNLVESLIPKVDKFRQDNFNKEGNIYRINTNNPTKIKPVDVREFTITSQQKQQALDAYTDFIARVSLGIIKNPTSGKYNYYDYNSIEDYLLKINKIEKQC